MPQIFDRSSNALARMSLILTGLIVIALGVTLDQLQRSPWVTRQGQRADQPVPFSHKHHVQGLGIQCQYCHVSVERSSYAGIPPTKTCMNCHAQIWTNAQLLEPVRRSWATGESIRWIKLHDLPDYVYFNHSIHVNKGIGCSSLSWPRRPDADHVPGELAADGVVPELPPQSGEEPAADERGLQHGVGRPLDAEAGLVRNHRRQGRDADGADGELHHGQSRTGWGTHGLFRHAAAYAMRRRPTCWMWQRIRMALQDRLAADNVSYTKFTNQEALGLFLLKQYHIRDPHELSSCETCHR